MEATYDDINPPRFYEPLPTGPYKGKTTNKEIVDKKMQIYFQTLGWDYTWYPHQRDFEKTRSC